jgi:NAD(P)-dependent dehydrogenase (short-subunit alcohol dehydrogenase family)
MIEKPVMKKVAVITGSGKGTGKAIAVAYAQAGASVVCAAGTKRDIEQTAYEIISAGGRAVAIPTDVTEEKSVGNLFRMAKKKFNAVDIPVINAGANYDRDLVESSASAH